MGACAEFCFARPLRRPADAAEPRRRRCPAGGVGDGVPALRASLHRLDRKVFDVDGLDRIIAVPVDEEDRKAPQRPSHVVEKQVADPEDQRRPDDGMGDSEATVRTASRTWRRVALFSGDKAARQSSMLSTAAPFG